MVRIAEEADFEFVKKSWTECFDDPPEFVDWNFEYNYNADDTVIAEIDGNPASVMQLVPYKLYIKNTEVETRYVSGVATMPEYRGKGLVRELFAFGIPQMKKMGCCISIIVPAVDGMYEKFGYEKVHKRYTYTAKSIEGLAVYNKIDDELISRLDKMYLYAMREKSVYIIRSRENWNKILTDLICISGGVVLMNENSGYALAYPNNDGYNVIEAIGEVCLDLERVEELPVMAKIIDKEALAEKVGMSDISYSAGELFGVLTAEKDAYINLLL